MRVRNIKLGIVLGLLAVWSLAGAASRLPEPIDLQSLLAPMKDFEAAVHVTKLEARELEKIGRDFATTYRLRTMTLRYKTPDKLRLEGKSRVLGDAVLVLNGPKRFYHVPRLGLKKLEALENEPLKQQSLLEFGGLVSRDTLRFMRPVFVGTEQLDGKSVVVYDLHYANTESRARHRCWIDPETRITRKRVWYGSDDQEKATFLYSGEKEVAPGIWMPGTCEIRNAEGISAATLTFEEIKINQGLPDTLFSVKS